MGDQCEKHDATMDRLFTEIHEIKQAQTETKTMMTEIRDFKNMIHGIVFGNGREGLLAKVSRVASQVKLQWALLAALLLAILAAMCTK